MRRMTFFPMIALTMLAVAACADSTAPPPPTPSEHITRGPDGPTGRNLFFLGRTIQNPTFLGTFDGTLHPVVSITGPSGAVATFGSGGTAGRVIVDPSRQEYRATWHPRHGSLGSGTYTVTVTVSELRLGYFDVIRADRMKDLRGIDTWNYVPMKDGQPLAIRFRIETGIAIPAGVPGLYLSHQCGVYLTCRSHSTPEADFYANDAAVRLTSDGGFGFAWTSYGIYRETGLPYGGTFAPVLDAAPTGTFALAVDPEASGVYLLYADGEWFGTWEGSTSSATIHRYAPGPPYTSSGPFTFQRTTSTGTVATR